MSFFAGSIDFEITLFLILALLVFSGMLLMSRIYKKRSGLRRTGMVDFGPLKLRLHKYAVMIGHEPSSTPLDSNALVVQNYHLSTGEHKILLGALKKIEAKNAVLSAVNIFLLTVGAKIYYDLVYNLNEWQRPVFLVCLLALFFMLLARVEGNGHLGQRRFNKLREQPVLEGSASLGVSMQEDLMMDLLKKESIFDFSYKVIAAVFFVAAFGIGVSALVEISRLVP